MARELSINFHYREILYTALVTVDDRDRTLDFNISIPDKALHNIIPGGNVNYSSSKGFYPYDKPKPEAQELLGCVVRALEERLFI